MTKTISFIVSLALIVISVMTAKMIFNYIPPDTDALIVWYMAWKLLHDKNADNA